MCTTNHQPPVYSTWLPWWWYSQWGCPSVKLTVTRTCCTLITVQGTFWSAESNGASWIPPLTPTYTIWKGRGDKHTKQKNSNTFSRKNTWVQKQPETTFTQKSTSTSSYMYANTETRCWSHLRNAKYLPLLPAWMTPPISSLSRLSINRTFKDSSPPGC